MEVRKIPVRPGRRKMIARPVKVMQQEDTLKMEQSLKEEIRNGKNTSSSGIPEPSVPVRIEAAIKGEKKKKLRVASYCRVSTGTLEQETSIINQRKHYEEYIRSNPDWEFAGVYWEADVSATKADNRPELQRLIADCEAGRIDLILTKSISRFSRNTTDCLQMVRTLTALGVNIRFEKENIYTGTMESEFMLTLFSSFAEEESRSISANTTWSIQKKFKAGSFRYSKAPFGYRLVDGNFEIEPEQAQIVKEIFTMALKGWGTGKIAKELNARNIRTGTKRNDGSPGVWTAYMVGGIIKNIAYTGDVINQKTFHEDFKLKINYGERQQYYNEGHHEAIIDKDTFEAANEAMRQRGRDKGNVPKDRYLRNNPHNNRYAFSGKLICGCCGGRMKRVQQKVKGGIRYHWVCVSHLENRESCPMKREQEESIRNAFSTMMNKLVFARELILDCYINDLKDSGKSREGTEALQEEMKKVKEERHRLTLLLSRGCGEPVSFRQKLLKLEAHESQLNMEIRSLQGDDPAIRWAQKLKVTLGEWIKNKSEPDAFFTEVCSKAVVKTGEYVEFHLKCGLRLKESLKMDRR